MNKAVHVHHAVLKCQGSGFRLTAHAAGKLAPVDTPL